MKSFLPIILIVSIFLFGCSNNNNENNESTKTFAELTTSNKNTSITSNESNTIKETPARIEYCAFMFGELPSLLILDKEKDIYITLVLYYGTNESMQGYIKKEEVGEAYTNAEMPVVKGDANNYVIRNADNSYTANMPKFKYKLNVFPGKDEPQITSIEWE